MEQEIHLRYERITHFKVPTCGQAACGLNACYPHQYELI